MKRIHFVKLLLVTVLACGNHFAWSADETITITYSDITQTSYNSSEVTFTDGVSFGYVNMMQNNANGTPTGWAKSQVIQCRASSTIRNTNAITGLKKIRVYLAVNTNTFTIYTSSSAITSKPNDGGTSRPTTATGTKEQTYTTYSNKQTGTGTTTLNYYDFDVASGQDYFFLSVGSSAVYIWSIELTYSSSSSGETTDYEKQEILPYNGVYPVFFSMTVFLTRRSTAFHISLFQRPFAKNKFIKFTTYMPFRSNEKIRAKLHYFLNMCKYFRINSII